MANNIHLHFDEEFFEKLKKDKLERQGKLGKEITWEVYFALLFGQTKLKGGKI